MYSSASQVAEYTPNLVGGEINFTEGGVPSRTAVERWLSAGCAIIEGRLKAAGYSVPVPGDAAVYDQISDLEALYGAARAELTRLSARVSVTERTRSENFMRTFTKGLDALLKLDLSRAGLTHTSKMYAGGISISDKESIEDESDRVQPRFKRGQFRMPGSQRPSPAADDETTE